MADRPGGLQRSTNSPQQSKGMSQGQGPSRGSSHELKEMRLRTGLETSYLQHRPQGHPRDWAGDSHT